MILRLAAAFVILGAWAPAGAQVADPPALEAARELLSTMDLERQTAETAARTSDAAIDTIMRQFRDANDREFPADLERALRQIVLEHNARLVALSAPTMREDAARIYARHFSAEELRELRRLQANPVMRKAETVMPQLIAELSQIGLTQALAMQPDLQRRIDEAIRAWAEDNIEPPAT